jgi:L-asparagine transporter-like permease
MRSVWGAVLVATILSEVLPPPTTSLTVYCLYCTTKIVLFLAVGYLTPLAFWRCDHRGLFVVALCSCLFEVLQSLVSQGHAFHWYEMILKMILIIFGFAVALEARDERRILHGPMRIRLVSPLFARLPVGANADHEV